MGRRFAGIARPRASIEQVDLPSRWSIFHKIRRGRAEGHESSIGAHGRRVAFVVRRTAIGRRREKSCMRLATWRSTFAGIPQEDLGAIVLNRGVGNKTPVETQCWRFFGNGSR